MRLTPRRRLAAATAALAVGTSLVLTAPALTATADPGSSVAFRNGTSGPSAQAPRSRPQSASWPIRRAIGAAGLRQHLQRLQILGDRYGSRATLTPGYDAAARYVEFQLREAGLNPRRDYYTYEGSNVIAQSLTVAGTPPTEVPIIAMSYTNSTPEGGVTGQLVQPTDANTEGCAAGDWAGTGVDGAVALIARGTCSFGEKAQIAGEAGAAAAIIYNNVEGPLNGTLGDAVIPTAAPVGGVTQEEGADLVAASEAGTEVTIDIRAEYFEAESYNVIADNRGGDTDNTILLGAHLDGVEEGAAINDNGTGVAALLEVADHLPRNLKNKVRFAFWGSEEVGLIGSTEYVNDLAARPGRPLDDIATYLNFDMLGSPNHIIGVYDADESQFPASAPVTAGSIETEAMFRSYFRSVRQPAVDTEFSGRSDYQAFLLNGVAAGGLFTGADGVKTPYQARVFGGRAGVTYDPNYHTPRDRLANVRIGALHTMADAIGHMAVTLGQSTRQIDVPQRDARSSARHRQLPSGLAAGPRR